MSILKKPGVWIGFAVFIASAALYIRTACPTLGGAFDSEEFQWAAYSLGIVHSTGYPLYLLLGKLFVTLVPIGSIAYRMNILSAFLTAGAVVLVYANSLVLTKRVLPAVAAAFLFATNPSVWRQAGVASVGPLHLLLASALLTALLLWKIGRAPLALVAAVFGFGLTNHSSILFLAPALIIFVVLQDPSAMNHRKEWARIGLAAALPLLLYLYIPIFGSRTPWYSNTLDEFIGVIAGGDAGSYVRVQSADILQGLSAIIQYLNDSFGYLGCALLILGAAGILADRRANGAATGLFLGIASATYFVWATLYAGEPDRYLVLPLIFIVYWFALGVEQIETLIGTISTRPVRRAAFALVAALIVLTVALPFGTRWSIADWSGFDRTYRQWDEIFTLPLPQNAVLVGNWGQLNAMRYMQVVEHRRSDLELVGTLYDTAPQTEAADRALAEGRAVFLAPGVALPDGSFRYGLIGPLTSVRNSPRIEQAVATASQSAPAIAGDIKISRLEFSTALEPYRPAAPPSLAPGQTLRISIEWKLEQVVSDFHVRVQLFDPEKRVVAQKDEPPVRSIYSPSLWTSGELVDDVHNLQIPPGAPPGTYTLALAIIRNASQITPLADTAVIVQHAFAQKQDQVFIQHTARLEIDKSISIVGYGGLDRPLHPGEQIGLSLLWNVKEKMPDDQKLHLALSDSSGQIVSTWERAPIGYYPITAWQPGELLKAYYELTVPSLPPGAYYLSAGLGGQPSVKISALQIIQ